MEPYYIKRMFVVPVIFGFLSVNCLYFLPATSAQKEEKPHTNYLDLTIPFQFHHTDYLILSPQEVEASVSTYDHWIKAAGRKYSLDPAMVKAVIHAESSFDPRAVSPAGAVGLMQLDPITIKELGIKDPFNPKNNIDGGARYLKDLLDTFEGNIKLALAAYNAGPSRVIRHKGVPPFEVTKKYLKQVFRYTLYYQNKRSG
jgi:soluble lytic murein transglycosylase-like protein